MHPACRRREALRNRKEKNGCCSTAHEYFVWRNGVSVTKTITDCISFHKMPTMQPTSKVSEETFLPLHGCGRSRVTCAGEQNKSRYAHCTESVQCIVWLAQHLLFFFLTQEWACLQRDSSSRLGLRRDDTGTLSHIHPKGTRIPSLSHWDSGGVCYIAKLCKEHNI